MWPTVLVTIGEEYSVNVYELLSSLSGIIEPVYLASVDITQQILDCPSPVEYRQYMEVDYIRMEKQ
jgi:hypothetical protein